MSKRFEKILELWAKERPVEAMRLQYGSFPQCPWSLYEEEPEEEAKKWFKSLKVEGINILYIYGIGLGSYYKPLKKWLSQDQKRHVIFIEDDYGVLQRFFETPLATKMLSDPQCSLVFVSKTEDADGVLETLYWSSALEPFLISALKSYEKQKSGFFENLRTKITFDRTMKNALVDEYLKYGAAFFANFYPNILSLEGAAWGNAFFGKFQGIPAIICGAGPSLEKQIKTLSTLKEKALIFAGGSSLNAVLSSGVVPHFGAGIDPNPTQMARLKASQAKGVPFFFRTGMKAEAAKNISGKKLYISGSGGYDIAEWYEKKFGLEAEFLDEGHNVVNFCSEIAARMGCNPIIYVGMDLAFTEMKAYSSGIEENVEVSEEKLLGATDEEYRGIYRKDIYGKPILTLWKWIAESEWLTRFSKQHPQIEFINATEGGIGFEGIPNIPLKEAIQEKLKSTFVLDGLIEETIKNAAMPQVTKKALEEATLEMKMSLARCIELIDILRKELEAQGDLASGSAVLAESDLYQEDGYVYLLDIFHQVFVRLQNKHVVELRLNKFEKDEKALAEQKLLLQKERLQFIRNVAEANIIFIDHAVENNVY